MGSLRGAAFSVLGAALGLVWLTGPARAAEITVMSSLAFKEAYSALVPSFEKSTGHKVTTQWVGSADIMKRMADGEAVDLVILAAASVDQLIEQGKVVPGSRADLAKSGIGVAVPHGAPRPDLTSTAALKRWLFKVKSAAYSSGPSGVYLAKLFDRWGLSDEIKLIKTKPGQPVGELLMRNGASVGFQQISELLPFKGIDYLGPVPADIQLTTVFSAGLHTQARSPKPAQALVKFLKAPAAAAVIRKTGMEPG
jgi:molybdate transport system substrate-binding protein